MKRFWILAFASATFLFGTHSVYSADEEYTLVIREHRFEPTELVVPAGRKFKLVVDNQDASPEEFESFELNREKVIPGHSKGTVFLGPLKAGSYKFIGEFHKDTARGTLTAGEK